MKKTKENGWLVGWLVGFNGISTSIGYLILEPFYIYIRYIYDL